MVIAAIVLFIIAAIFGLVVLTAVLKNEPTPKLAVFIHGPLAAIALIIIIVYAFMSNVQPLLLTSIILFILAALGGLTLFTIDMKKRPIPKTLAVLHPILAVAALVILIIYAVQALQ